MNNSWCVWLLALHETSHKAIESEVCPHMTLFVFSPYKCLSEANFSDRSLGPTDCLSTFWSHICCHSFMVSACVSTNDLWRSRVTLWLVVHRHSALAPSPLRFTTRCGYSPYVTSSLMRRSVMHLFFVTCTFLTCRMLNAVFWNVVPCGSCKNLCFGGT
jgi:hypothetical protein